MKVRFHYLDSLRAFVMIIGVVYHAIQMGLEGRTNETYPALENTLFIMHAWRMPVFFLLSGFFTQLLIERKGVSETFHNRYQRLVVPFLLCLFFILPLNSFFIYAYAELSNLKVATIWNIGFVKDAVAYWLRKPRLHHLWFLYYLIGFVALWCGGIYYLSNKRGLPKVSWRPLIPAILFASLALMESPFQVDAPTRVYYRPFTFIYYFAFFILGTEMYKSLRLTQRWAIPKLNFVAVSLAFSTLLVFLVNRDGVPRLVQVPAVLSFTMTGCFFLLSSFQTYFEKENNRVRYLIASSYWVYLAHEPVLHIFGTVLKTYQWTLTAEISFLTIATYTVCFASYSYLIQGSLIDAILNGKTSQKKSEFV